MIFVSQLCAVAITPTIVMATFSQVSRRTAPLLAFLSPNVAQSSLRKLEAAFNSFSDDGTMALSIALLDNSQASKIRAEQSRAEQK